MTPPLLEDEAVETEDGYRITPFKEDGWLLTDLISGKEFCLSPEVVAEVAETPIPDHVDREDVEECVQTLYAVELASKDRDDPEGVQAARAGRVVLERVLERHGGDDGGV